MKYVIPDLRNRIAVRPRLKFDSPTRQWMCSTYYGSFRAYGETPYAAWVAWKVKDQRTKRIPRKGYWERKSCMSWFRGGCYIINSWVGGQVIAGYDPTTDELILKG